MNKNNNKNNLERLNNYKAEADEIIGRLKTDPKFCQRFFYGTKLKECNIAPLRMGMLSYLAHNYQVEMSADCFNTIVYLTLWSNGTWSVLDTYRKQTTFFAWLKKVAKNAVLERLAEEHIIPSARVRTPGNTRLTLLSQPVEKCQLIIDEQLAGSAYHDLMIAVYVNRLSKESMMERFALTERELDNAIYKSEYTLKDALLRSTSSYAEEVLRNKTRDNSILSLEVGCDLEEWVRSRLGESSLGDVFGITLTDEEIREKVVNLLCVLSSKMNWSERDRYIWRQRFIYSTPPVEVATAFNRTRAWVDTRFSRLNNEIEPSLKRWWAAYAA